MKNVFMKLIAKVAFMTAYGEKHKHCTFASFQPKMPQQLLKDEK